MGEKRIHGRYVYRWCCTIFLASLATAAFSFVWYEFAKDNNQTGHLLGRANLLMSAGIYLILYLIIGKALKAFRIGVDRKANLLASQVLALFCTNGLETFVSCAITGQFRFYFSFFWRYLLLFLGQSFVYFFLVIWFVDVYRKIFPAQRILEVYSKPYDYNLDFMDERPDKYTVVGKIDIAEGIDKVLASMKNCDAVLINDIPSEMKNDILKACFKEDKRVYFTPKISDIIEKTSEEINLFDTPLYLCRNAGLTWGQTFVKRLCDIFFSLLGFILASPFMLITAIAIKLEDGGPVFFRQKRVTYGGKEFEILKFRSMIVDAEKDGKPHPAGENDDRITKVGKIIRPTRIDELPQLINILIGDMSIVGPRPERVEHVKKYTEDIPEFAYRLKVKGGLTGPAQVFGKYNTSPLNKLKMDLYYITNYSILLDLQIVFETIKILAQKSSTEGFSKDKQEEMHDSK